MNDSATIELALRRVFGAAARIERAQAVSASPENRSWHAVVEDSHVIAKTPERSGGLTIAPALEYELLGSAAAAGIGPQPLGFDEHTGMLFIEHIGAGDALEPGAMALPDIVARLAEILRKLHALEAPSQLRVFDPTGFADDYCAGGSSAALRLRDELEGLSARFARSFAGEHVCHNDLHAGNVLLGHRLWLIDFEYAVRAAPIVDYASYAAFNGLDATAALTLARAGLGEDLPFSGAELAGVIRIQRILGELWEIARSDNNGVR